MSRIGKLPIEIPAGVEVKIEGHVVTVKGPLGTEVVEVRPEVDVKIEDNHVIVTRKDDSREARSLHGLSRTLIANAVKGVKDGFVKNLEIQGVGYRANMEGKNLNLALGYSHPVIVEPPVGITITVEANTKPVVQIEKNDSNNKLDIELQNAYLRAKNMGTYFVKFPNFCDALLFVDSEK